jgi:hypothetical protein
VRLALQRLRIRTRHHAYHRRPEGTAAVSLLYTYLDPDIGDGDHGHTCPECDDRFACGLGMNRCVDPETMPCPDCAGPVRFAVCCEPCELFLVPLDLAAHAFGAAAAHDDVWHGGTPTALVRPN